MMTTTMITTTKTQEPATTVRKLHQLFDEAKDLWFDTYEAPGIEGYPIRAVPDHVGSKASYPAAAT